jgi:hypothetical protein
MGKGLTTHLHLKYCGVCVYMNRYCDADCTVSHYSSTVHAHCALLSTNNHDTDIQMHVFLPGCPTLLCGSSVRQYCKCEIEGGTERFPFSGTDSCATERCLCLPDVMWVVMQGVLGRWCFFVRWSRLISCVSVCVCEWVCVRVSVCVSVKKPTKGASSNTPP